MKLTLNSGTLLILVQHVGTFSSYNLSLGVGGLTKVAGTAVDLFGAGTLLPTTGLPASLGSVSSWISTAMATDIVTVGCFVVHILQRIEIDPAANDVVCKFEKCARCVAAKA